MPAPAITVENLSKSYLVGHRNRRDGEHTALREILGREFRNVARKAIDVVSGRQVIQGDEIEEFWALRDVSFEVRAGEVLGIIGRNGAGKSTLLKILSRITEPTAGRVTLRGRVASLLEVGTGFHPELTGRENVYLNGAILGMSRAEIRRKFDEIIAFAEIEKFLDTPVKRYSSGMYVRLAFAVAAHLDPEILIVDEVLAVGDVSFQKKCLGKMSQVASGGRTIIFVSHDMGAVVRLCSRAMVLDHGTVITTSDDVSKTIETYTSVGRGKLDTGWVNVRGEYSNQDFIPISLRVCPVEQIRTNTTSPNANFVVEIVGDVLRDDPALVIAFCVYGAGGQLLFTSGVHDAAEGDIHKLPVGRVTFRVALPIALFNDGEHEVELIAMLHMRVFLIAPGSGPRVRFINSLHYASPYWNGRRDGVIAPKLIWEAELDTSSELRTAHSQAG